MIGFGFDIHRLAAGESLVLGGVTVDSTVGTVAHSDGDVILHALVDALLGSVGMGDIGEHFPDTDPRWRGVSSSVFVAEALRIVTLAGRKVVNIDATLVLERPKISPYKEQMRDAIANMCGLPRGRVNIKATTSEAVGAIGRGEAVQAWVVCMVMPA
jgi:2-C-methyl-D-erythritol 2,4-cyclodiphosphate synthase